ncbi:aldehyde ferredoxin oxidoreductase family protein [Gudongella sp. DL1XJH-153]|uniref:aldehyde ferredoxin oxidoreductase family protein n=1 Tax=Gudongella sp. DL1XJH-153 TaxID=3409804 RepID=UPI003BB4898A
MRGYMGKVLFVDLSTGDIHSEEVPDRIYENFLSGVGLGAYYLHKTIPQGADPLGKDNVLGFVSGLLTGTGSVVTGRWMAVGKSPITGGWGDSNCGGNLSPAIKRSGYDGIFFRGISEKPAYLYIDDDGPKLMDASELWGKDAVEAEELLLHLHGKDRKCAVATIGQAGEKMSLIAGISNDKGRMAARSGLGAVMGSKKLKAIVLTGTGKIEAYDKEMIMEITREYSDKVKNVKLPGMLKGSMLPMLNRIMEKAGGLMPQDGMMSVPMMKRWGTIFSNTFGLPSGDCPVKNWDGSILDYHFSSYKNMNPDRIIEREEKKYYCYSCVIGCGGVCNISDVTKGRFEHTHKPEYETVNSFGALLLNESLESIYYINEIMNRAGMDTISAGNTIAFAIECYENGLITKEDTDGLELTWGNSEAIVALSEKMVSRKGIGDVLADGVRMAAARIGKDSERYAINAGGQEPGMHDPRLDPILGIHFSADPTPGRHTIGAGLYYNYMRLWDFVTWAPKITNKSSKVSKYKVTDEVALKSVANSCIKQVLDGSGGCLFAMISGLGNWRLFDYLNGATGWNKTPDEYMEIGKRMQTLRQMFNIREGIDPISFKMHDRIAGNPPMKEGPLKGRKVPIEDMMKGHWKHFGWDENTGIPLEETIEELGILALLEAE